MRAGAFLFRQGVLDFNNLYVFGQDVADAAGLAGAGVLLYLCDNLLLLYGNPSFRLVKEQAELLFNLFGGLLGLRAKLLALNDAQLLHEPPVLFPQLQKLSVFRAGNGHHLRVACLRNNLSVHI